MIFSGAIAAIEADDDDKEDLVNLSGISDRAYPQAQRQSFQLQG